ncbi:MAG: hypothetical protein P8J33_16880 [Pirellulaceae bacterium]|nr:hypothetical protein [Pirellulaceae bacterium]
MKHRNQAVKVFVLSWIREVLMPAVQDRLESRMIARPSASFWRL